MHYNKYNKSKAPKPLHLLFSHMIWNKLPFISLLNLVFSRKRISPLSVFSLSCQPSLVSPPLFSKEDDFTGSTLKEEVEKLHEERNMLLETIDDLQQTVETGAVPELNTKVRTANDSTERQLLIFTCADFKPIVPTRQKKQQIR